MIYVYGISGRRHLRLGGEGLDYNTAATVSSDVPHQEMFDALRLPFSRNLDNDKDERHGSTVNKTGK